MKINAICPYCNGTKKTTLDGTFKKHDCACKNGKIEKEYEFGELIYGNTAWVYKPYLSVMKRCQK